MSNFVRTAIGVVVSSDVQEITGRVQFPPFTSPIVSVIILIFAVSVLVYVCHWFSVKLLNFECFEI